MPNQVTRVVQMGCRFCNVDWMKTLKHLEILLASDDSAARKIAREVVEDAIKKEAKRT